MLFFKPLFQLAIIIRHALVAVIIEEQAKRQTIGFPVLYHAGTAFTMIGASRFRTSTFFYVRTRHITNSYFNSMQSPQQSGTQIPQPVHFSSLISMREPSGSSSSSIHEIAFEGHSVSGLQIRLSDEHFLLSIYAFILIVLSVYQLDNALGSHGFISSKIAPFSQNCLHFIQPRIYKNLPTAYRLYPLGL